ncbi:hypothetical protein EIN_241470, partial [Entamoeba invadens IP1]
MVILIAFFDLNQNITQLQIDCTGSVKLLHLYENTNIFITKNAILIRINQVNFSNNGKSFVFLENATKNSVMSNCHLVDVTRSGLKCVSCQNEYRIDNTICLPIDKNCENYNKNNKCVLCKNKFVLNANYECVSSEKCMYGTITNCYKCQDRYTRNDTLCMLDDKCEYSDGSICIICKTGNVYNKCENCTAHCRLCKNEKCLICDNNFILNNESVCVEMESGVSNGISTIWCYDTFYIANGICNDCTLKHEHSVLCNKNNTISCEVDYNFLSERLCISSICQNETFNEENGMCNLPKANCVLIVNNKCIECEDNYILDNNNNCVYVANDTLSTGCVLYNQYGCISCDIGYYLSNTKCHRCSENCSSCIDLETKCLSCKSGYYQGEDYT